MIKMGLSHAECLYALVVLLATTIPAVHAAPAPPSALRSPSEQVRHLPELFHAALVAGGCHDPAELERWSSEFHRFCAQQQSLLEPTMPLPQQAARLLRALHDRYLQGSFQPGCFRLDQTLCGQAHNCLTSTLLFVSLCRCLDLPCRVVGEPSHVFCLLVEDGAHGVQTLLPEGVVPAAPGAAEPLTDQQLLARVYYNRGTALLSAQRLRAARDCLAQALQLDPHQASARQNLIATWNELALELCDLRQYPQAATAVVTALALDPQQQVTQANDAHIHHHWVADLCGQGDFARAWEVLERCRQRRPDVPLFDRGRGAVLQAWAQDRARRAVWEESDRRAFTRAWQCCPAATQWWAGLSAAFD